MWQLRIKIKSISKVHPCTFESYFGVQPETTHNSVFAVRSAHSNAFGTSQTRGTLSEIDAALVYLVDYFLGEYIMSTNIYLVRHAEVNYIPDDFKRPLSAKGKKDVKKVTDFFKDKSITKILSSPYLRALDTIKGVALEKGIEIEKIHDCRERKVANEYIEDFDTFIKKQWEDFDYHLEGGESLNQVQKRAISVIFDILERYQNENIIIGTHGTWLSVVLNYFDQKYDFNFWKTIKMPDIFLLVFNKRELKSIKHFQV